MAGRGRAHSVPIALVIVSDASPLIAFSQIGRLDLLRQLFGTMVVPPIVAREAEPSLPALPAWIEVRPLADPRGLDPSLFALDGGERDAIALAIELSADWIVLDDLPARKTAEALGLRVIGSAGVVLRAKDRDLLTAAKPMLDALVAAGLFVGQELYRQVLLTAGELP